MAISKVILWGRVIGAVSYNNGDIEFSYDPNFIGQGIELSPLARANDIDKTLTDRFQLVINGAEIINAYSEFLRAKIFSSIHPPFEPERAAVGVGPRRTGKKTGPQEPVTGHPPDRPGPCFPGLRQRGIRLRSETVVRSVLIPGKPRSAKCAAKAKKARHPRQGCRAGKNVPQAAGPVPPCSGPLQTPSVTM